MYCPKCGKQLPENADFCSGCGAVVSQRKEKAIKQGNTSFDNQNSKGFSFAVIFSGAINVLCIMLYIFPWIQLKEINIPSVYKTASSHAYNMIDLFLTNTDEAVGFYRYFYEQDIVSLMNILKIVCCIGTIALIWHAVSILYLLIKKRDTPLQYIRYAVTAIIAFIFMIISIRLNMGDFSLNIPIDPELTDGLSSSVSFDLAQYLSVTKVPIFMALVSSIGFIKCVNDNKKSPIKNKEESRKVNNGFFE